MKVLTQIRFYVVAVSIAFITLLVFYFNQQEELKKCQVEKGFIPGGDIEKAEMQTRLDSLHDELFNETNMSGRYELMLDHLKEKYPKIGLEMEEWLNHETE
jgi:hypothetical protein